jgi:LPS O-antigen subunit length determinant protein (WzzB/FepE family)
LKIREWWQYLWSKKWIIIAAGLIGGLLGFGYAYTKKPVYTATTTFILENSEGNSRLGAYAGVASMMGIDLGGGGGGIFQGDNILDLYKSRKMIETTLFSSVDTVSWQPLIERYIQINDLRRGWENNDQLKKLKFKLKDLNLVSKDRLRDSIIGVIVDDISKNYLTVAKPDKKLSRIQVVVKSIDETFSKRFNEELVKNVNEFYVNTKTKKSLDNINILQNKTDSVRAVMNGAIYNAVAVADATPNANPTRQVQRVAPIQRAQFSAETNKAILAEMMKNLEVSKLALLKETPLIQVIDGPVYPLEKEKFGKLKGLILGGFVLGFVTVLILVLRKVFKQY